MLAVPAAPHSTAYEFTKTSEPMVKQFKARTDGPRDNDGKYYVAMRVPKPRRKGGGTEEIKLGPVDGTSSYYDTRREAEKEALLHRLTQEGYVLDEATGCWSMPEPLPKRQRSRSNSVGTGTTTKPPLAPTRPASAPTLPPPAAGVSPAPGASASSAQGPVPVGLMPGVRPESAEARRLRALHEATRKSSPSPDLPQFVSEAEVTAATAQPRASRSASAAARENAMASSKSKSIGRRVSKVAGWKHQRQEQQNEALLNAREENEAWRAGAIARLGAALQRGTEADLLVHSERQVNLAKGDAAATGGEVRVPVSEAQQARVKEQCRGVLALYQTIDRHHFSVGDNEDQEMRMLECCEASVESQFLNCAPKTLDSWRRQYEELSNEDTFGEGLGGFLADSRGDHDHDTLLQDNPDLKRKLVNFIQANLRGLTSMKVQQFINTVLLPSIDPDPARLALHLQSYRIKIPIARPTTFRYMIQCGCSYNATLINYYTDKHEDPLTIMFREQEYLPREFGPDLLRMPTFIQLTEAEFDEVQGKHEQPIPHFKYRKPVLVDAGWAGGTSVELCERLGMEMEDVGMEDGRAGEDGPPAGDGTGEVVVEVNVDDSESLDLWRSTVMFGGNMSGRALPCQKMLFRIGQDEACYASNITSTKHWTCLGKSYPVPKGSGATLMVSGWQCTAWGFGLPMTEQQLAEVNAKRLGTHYISAEAAKAVCKSLGQTESTLKPPLARSPGVRLLSVGVNKEGYKTADHHALEAEDMADCHKHLYPHVHMEYEFDWSSGHAKKKVDGLAVAQMNRKYAGKAKPRRDSVIGPEPGFLGPFPAERTVVDAAGVTSTIDAKLKVGETQSFVFKEGDLPPRYHPNTPKYDVVVGKKKKKKAGAKKKKKVGPAAGHFVMRQAPGPGVEAGEGDVEGGGGDGGEGGGEVEVVAEDEINIGYVDKSKGMEDILFERGFLDPARDHLKGNGYSLKGTTIDHVTDKTYSLKHMLACCFDFQHETSMIEGLCEELGISSRMCIKCHPEVAGVGIEYSWGKSKYHYRRHNDFNMGTMEQRVLESIGPEVLTLERVRKFNRKARSYKLAYWKLSQGASAGSVAEHADIEKMTKVSKAHRCTFDQDYKFVSVGS